MTLNVLRSVFAGSMPLLQPVKLVLLIIQLWGQLRRKMALSVGISGLFSTREGLSY